MISTTWESHILSKLSRFSTRDTLFPMAEICFTLYIELMRSRVARTMESSPENGTPVAVVSEKNWHKVFFFF